ncbi:MAG: NAD-binding protein [Alphaproteobacteria bacterium]|nr:NAD-binding protein [Alphaproteobacteria bacterium]MCW5742565.1 NAD-binding protein [Alphaproteobacteria bacterium]
MELRELAAPRRRRRPGATFRPRLVTRHDLSPVRVLSVRLAIVLGLLAITVAMFWFKRDELVDTRDDHVSFTDVVYFTMVTITTVGYGDIVPVTQSARLIDAIVVTPIRLAVLLIFAGTAYQMLVQRMWEEWRMDRLAAAIKDHILVCGFGITGHSVAGELVGQGVPADRIVAIDPSDRALDEAAHQGYHAIRGEASNPEVLADAAVKRARGVMVCVDRDDTAMQICLAVRLAAPKMRIVAALTESRLAPLVRQAGADVVLSPSRIGGVVLADALVSPDATGVLLDMLSARGDAAVSDRAPLPEEIGRDPRSLPTCVVLALRRGGETIWPWDARAHRIEPTDRLVVLRRADDIAPPSQRPAADQTVR